MGSRADREKEQYNQGLQRKFYNRVFRHCSYYYNKRSETIRKTHLAEASNKKILELGAYSWINWLEEQEIIPLELHCINISERELAKGEQLYGRTEFNRIVARI